MSVSPERLANALEAYNNDGGNERSDWIKAVLIADERYCFAHIKEHALYNAAPVDPEREPKLPEGVTLENNAYFCGRGIGGAYVCVRKWTPEMLRAVADHMEYMARPKPAPVPEVNVTDDMVMAACKACNAGLTMREMRLSIQAALRASGNSINSQTKGTK